MHSEITLSPTQARDRVDVALFTLRDRAPLSTVDLPRVRETLRVCLDGIRLGPQGHLDLEGYCLAHNWQAVEGFLRETLNQRTQPAANLGPALPPGVIEARWYVFSGVGVGATALIVGRLLGWW